jgi:hypothetical protein
LISSALLRDGCLVSFVLPHSRYLAAHELIELKLFASSTGFLARMAVASPVTYPIQYRRWQHLVAADLTAE